MCIQNRIGKINNSVLSYDPNENIETSYKGKSHNLNSHYRKLKFLTIFHLTFEHFSVRIFDNFYFTALHSVFCARQSDLFDKNNKSYNL